MWQTSSRSSNAQDEESRPISLGEIGKCVSYSNTLVRVQVNLRVDLAELREVPGPPPLRIPGRPSFGCQRVDRFQDNLHYTVGLSLDFTTHWSIV